MNKAFSLANVLDTSPVYLLRFSLCLLKTSCYFRPKQWSLLAPSHPTISPDKSRLTLAKQEMKNTHNWPSLGQILKEAQISPFEELLLVSCDCPNTFFSCKSPFFKCLSSCWLCHLTMESCWEKQYLILQPVYLVLPPAVKTNA